MRIQKIKHLANLEIEQKMLTKKDERIQFMIPLLSNYRIVKIDIIKIREYSAWITCLPDIGIVEKINIKKTNIYSAWITCLAKLGIVKNMK